MSKRSGKQRAAANTAETATMTVNEKILKECHELYVSEDKGIIIGCNGHSYLHVYYVYFLRLSKTWKRNRTYVSSA